MATINGNANANTLLGTSNADTIKGFGGADSLFGDAGSDTIYGGAGNDRLFGDDGDDRLFGEGGNDLLTGGRGNDRIDGGALQHGLVFRHGELDAEVVGRRARSLLDRVGDQDHARIGDAALQVGGMHAPDPSGADETDV